MRSFLLKQMKQIPKSAVAKVPTLNIKPSLFPYTMLTAAMVVTMSVAYAEQPMSDAELETKYIEVKIKPVCSTEKEKIKEKDKKQSCQDTNVFVIIVTNKQDSTSESDAAQSKDSDSSALLASIFDNIRLLGGTDVLGVPAGVANTGTPLLFGSENYSDKWAGNFNQIFQPVTLSGGSGIPPGTAFSVYDTSSLGYGFNNEAHFPDGLPVVTIQSISISPRN
jgi:hypothetical protein